MSRLVSKGIVPLIFLTYAGCAAYGPVSNTSAPLQSTVAAAPPSSPQIQSPSLAAAVTPVAPSLPEPQPHPTEILVEDGLAQVITAEEAKSNSVDLWIESGDDKRYLRFRNPFLKMQWDIVNLRLKDPKETPIKLGTKLDSRFETMQGGGSAENPLGDMQQMVDALSPMLNSASFGGGGYGGGFGGSGLGQMGQLMEGVQKINAYTKNKADAANQSAHETYITRINEMFMQDGFAVTSIRKDAMDFSLEKPDYVVEEIWATSLSGGIVADSFRVFTGEGQLLFQSPYYRTHFGISLFLRSRMVTGEIDIKSEKYSTLMEAVNLWGAGDESSALNEFQKALDLDPKFVNAYRYRSKYYEAKGQWKEAIDDLSNAIGILRARQQIKALYERGQLHWKINQYDAAIKDFDQVLSWEPKAVWVQANRGFTWMEKGDLGKASLDFEAALSLDPQYDVALAGRAWVLALRGEYQPAITLFNQVLATSPNYANALRGRGYCHKMLREREKAKEDLVTALQQLSEDSSPIAEKRRLQIEGWMNELQLEVPIPAPMA